jgi:hypothetical protein
MIEYAIVLVIIIGYGIYVWIDIFPNTKFSKWIKEKMKHDE